VAADAIADALVVGSGEGVLDGGVDLSSQYFGPLGAEQTGKCDEAEGAEVVDLVGAEHRDPPRRWVQAAGTAAEEEPGRAPPPVEGGERWWWCKVNASPQTISPH
jgi:hypothetical protein